MVIRKIFYFAIENLNDYLKRHFAIVLLSCLLIFCISSVFFTSYSLNYTLKQLLEAEPDFVLQKVIADRVVPMHSAVGDELIEIAGITKVTPRIYGRYFLRGLNKSVLLLGVDFFDEQSHQGIEEIISKTDLNHFFSTPNAMIVGSSVHQWMLQQKQMKQIKFFTPKGECITLNQAALLPSQLNFLSADVILTTLENARKILGLKKREVIDFTFNVPNKLEWEWVGLKVASLDYDLRIIDKKMSDKAYEELYDFKGGIFLVLLMITILTFMMILYNKYTHVYTSQRRYIGILRASGWSIKNVLLLNFIEASLLIVITYLIGTTAAYYYLFNTESPLSVAIFMGSWNFDNSITLPNVVDPFTLISIFLIYALPYLCAVLVPVWSLSSRNPVEVLR